uniref:Uncharacterized protein n=2 Tax=Anguilla anguilla TaxID=7936 RepID=A0A0E9S5P1_ANGAN
MQRSFFNMEHPLNDNILDGSSFPESTGVTWICFMHSDICEMIEFPPMGANIMTNRSFR